MRKPTGGDEDVTGSLVSRPVAGIVRARLSRRALAVFAALALLLAGAGASSATSATRPDLGPSAVTVENPELAIITPPESSDGGEFGSSVALSTDGSTALVGAPKANGGTGAAWVFTRSGGKWDQAGSELTMPSEDSRPGDCGNEEPRAGEEGEEGEEVHVAEVCRFGLGVALTANGDMAVVGAPHASNNDGGVWIFTRSGSESTWTRGPELTNPEPGRETRFGWSVAVSADGDTVLVGAPMWRGRVWVFTRSGSSGWSPDARPLEGGGGEGEASFGRSVALSADGDTALIGAPGYPQQEGAAWVFAGSGSAWGQPGVRLSGAGAGSEARFGFSVALSGDGATALVGARGAGGNDGAAWVFAHSEDGWSEQGSMLTGAGEGEERFGAGVALSYDGDRALIGAPHSGARSSGAAWLFERSAGSWADQPRALEAGVAKHNLFGWGVALSGDGETRLVGGSAAGGTGAAWVFGLNPAVEAVTPARGPSSGGTSVTITGEHLAGATAVRFGSSEAASFGVSSGKSITAVAPAGSGTVDVTVETPVGLSAETRLDRFTYTAENSGGKKDTAGDKSTTSAGQPGAVVLAFGPATGRSCDASLLSGRISVRGHHRAVLKLRRLGGGKCTGKLSLTVRVRRWGHHRRGYRTQTIGRASFSIASGSTALVTVKLNAAGRRLLKAYHGRLRARVLILKSTPAPARLHTARVQLVQ